MNLALLLPTDLVQRGRRAARLDNPLLGAAATLLGIGIVMVASSSMPTAERLGLGAFYFATRQTLYVLVGIATGVIAMRIPLQWWQRSGFVCLVLALGMLALVVIPGVGKTVNGSTRWINLGVFQLQVSEFAKLFLFVYLSGYLVRHSELLATSMVAFLKPLLVLAVAGVLLLLEPDFGATVVLIATAMTMILMGGVAIWRFATLLIGAGSVLALVAVSSSYRMHRLTAFMDPWRDPYDTGFQLTQSLIAIGRGEWFGVGLGASVQKLFYLPEAHTDFVFAVLAEELGLVGVAVVLCLYGVVVWRSYRIAFTAMRNGNAFAGYLAYGIGTWIALQTLINVGVNTGLLPTKGLTLPFLSYGGSSILVVCAAVGVLLRIDQETRCTAEGLAATGVEPSKRRRAA